MSQLHGTAAGSQDLLACETCGRHFAQDVLLRHEPICRKVFNKKRKTFNSLKQRLQGTEIPSVKKQPPPKKQPEKKSNWRQLHEDFNAIQSAKQVAKAMKEGRPLPLPPPPSINPDYIQCPYCLRRFNEAAAERHISFCKEQATRRVFAPGQKAAKQAPGKQQMTQRREPTLTSAVESLLQNRAQEAAIAGPAVQSSAGMPERTKKTSGVPFGKNTSGDSRMGPTRLRTEKMSDGEVESLQGRGGFM
ncbi:zinc finger C2HC domain-containing protein 1B [Gopherus flavomarginatus]|uniref:zinc finger C2HC domain-containing protein 1B n=1 Tax=Gopherus flavomarginatus TaxID=286002 RepID=UPI0021CBCF06|nr:zinc finger C2HC domain-containing protein 1B [Gopherus flavomarginatus]